MILVFGSTGQVARELSLHSGPRRVICLNRAQVDLSNPALCAAAIARHRPDAVINAAAYTAVDRAEKEETLAHVINAQAPTAMARICADEGLPFVHLSTDYVFDGSDDTARTPDAPTGPQNAYGRTKLAGEQAIRAAEGAHTILRTSWVFSAHGTNFLKTMLKLAETRDALNVVDDQIGGPTPACGVAQALLQITDAMLDGQTGGTHHYTGKPETSWADFAREIFAHASKTVSVTGIPTSEYPTPAARPLNSRLDCTSLRRTFSIEQPQWRTALVRIVKELT
jgi:dTDP-4-dehydrorhamnose reductase